jgi:hypothetical protein
MADVRPYVDGAPLAIRGASALRGVDRGLDAVLDLWRGGGALASGPRTR